MKTEAEMEVCSLSQEIPGIAGHYQKLGRDKRVVSPNVVNKNKAQFMP